MNAENTDKIIKEIFLDIDKAINDNITNSPVKISESRFIKKYEEIKKRFKR